VLAKYPRLRIVFAHFLFLSADLRRAGRLLDAYPGISLDMTPGIELLYTLSKNITETVEFFTSYSDRIIYGTDIISNLTFDVAEARSGILTRWLETADEYRLPDTADFNLGPPENGIMHGLSLPEDVIRKIYLSNFERLVGPRPRPLDTQAASEEAARITAGRKRLSA